MYTKLENFEIYVGQGAGGAIYNDIKNTKQEITIISPFISSYIIEELLRLSKKGVLVNLITSDEVRDFNVKDDGKMFLYKLIKQNKIFDKKANIIKNIGMIISAISIIVSLIYNIKHINQINEYSQVALICVIIFSIILFINFKKMKPYKFYYESQINLKIFVAPKMYEKRSLDKLFIHSKIYIIDDKIAYLGSLNSTFAGFNDNYETRIKITEKNAINAIIQESKRLFETNKYIVKDIQKWGQEIYQNLNKNGE